ncbi:hypothetical protein CTAYLR_005341 [Chrysophaeum taylorii]|uniref:FAD dependent oxidoreductase domain-containing protein n=1 Tax=Chrysophaeum taylorii TaxID=2483200 RepID=A0AAD7XFG5_9STRA|nr:hypothetical protein CTAYLR_005341 [Chrysophaeum taylorii]
MGRRRRTSFHFLLMVSVVVKKTTPAKVVIAGGGVMGCSTAYCLAKNHGISSVVVDRVGVAAAASGRAGGFLARSWNDGAPTQELTHRSFELHAELGEELKAFAESGSTDYRRLTCEAVSVASGGRPSNAKLKNVDWVDLGALGSQHMGNESGIAQVHPRKFCDALMRGATELAGSKTRVARATGLRTEGNKVTGLVVDDGEVIEADAVVVALGPWSHVVGRPPTETQCDTKGWGVDAMPPVVGTKYHAVLLQSPRVLSQAVFFQGMGDPEVYPRPDGEVYVTGFPERAAIVEDLPGETKVLDEVCDRLISTIDQVSTELRGARVNGKQACHLPAAPDGVPLIGAIPGLDGAFAATGHGCWGILLSPATGEAMADLIATGTATKVDLSAFDPARYEGPRSFF